MEVLLWIAGIMLAIYLALVYWPITLGIAIVWLIIHLVRKELEAEKERRRELERQRSERERLQREHDQQQAFYLASLASCRDTSLSLFERMPLHLMETEALLDQAERDFQERAFAPFWSSVQRAAGELGRYDHSVRMITDKAREHSAIVEKYEGEAPPFPLDLRSAKGIEAAKPTTERLSVIVRKAQRDFEFATIYEQRKTNQLLVAGFTNLAQALEGMGRHIASSIEDLSSQVAHVSRSVDNLAAGQKEYLADLRSAVQDHSEQARAQHEESLQRHDKALDMLEQFQRRRTQA